LRTLRERYAFKEATTADLEKIFEEFLPNSLRYEQRKSLDWFFTGWVNGTAIPTLKIEDLKFTTRAEQRYANFTLTQKDAPKDLVTSVPIYAVLSENRRTFAGRVFADGETSSIRLRVPAGTKKLELDPMETILRRP
jgi:aminopeptidase N